MLSVVTIPAEKECQLIAGAAMAQCGFCEAAVRRRWRKRWEARGWMSLPRVERDTPARGTGACPGVPCLGTAYRNPLTENKLRANSEVSRFGVHPGQW